jgi:hypothetical protein
MSEASPWDDIGVPGNGFQVRQAAGDTAVPCYWGRNSRGDCLFILELSGDHTAQFGKDRTVVRGVNVDLRTEDELTQRLVLTLERQIDRDIFAGFCRTLTSALTNAGDPASSLAVALAHLRRWKAFMSGRGGDLLSPEEVRGLFGELTFFLELVERRSFSADTVAAWMGPDRSHQDFIFGNTAVEIKTLSGDERSVIRISSEDQLESLQDELFLRAYRLSNMPDSAQARSLNEIVKTAQTLSDEAGMADEFDRKLAMYGYAPLPDYDEPRFIVSKVTTYAVTDAFPRLARSGLPGGIMNVTYGVKLEAIAAFECDGECVFGGN